MIKRKINNWMQGNGAVPIERRDSSANTARDGFTSAISGAILDKTPDGRVTVIAESVEEALVSSYSLQDHPEVSR